MSKKKGPMTVEEILAKLREAGLSSTNVIKSSTQDEMSELDTLDNRVKRILSITSNNNSNPKNMLFFVMYDIESNKVRRLVAKYLIRQGCFRIQRSIYLADLSSEKCEQIKSDLAEVQAAYDNKDSIFVVPISTDYLKAMKVIGKALDVNIIMHSQNTLFF